MRLRAKVGISVIISGCMAAGADRPGSRACLGRGGGRETGGERASCLAVGMGARRAARHVQRHTAASPPQLGTTRWVSNTATLGTAPGTSCADPGYATISDALAAATPATTIKVCAGTYDEQLAITQGVILQRATDAVTVVGPPARPIRSPPATRTAVPTPTRWWWTSAALTALPPTR